MIGKQERDLQVIPHESRSELIGQYRQASEAFQQISNVICKGEFSEGDAKETTLEFYSRFAEFSSPRYSSIRKEAGEAGFGDRNNDFAQGDYQKSTEIIGDTEKAESYRKASMDLLEQGRIVINAGGGDEECDTVGWNFIKLGLYLQTKTLFESRPQLEEDVRSTADVRSPDTMSFLGDATENEVKDSLKKELKKFVQRRTFREKVKDSDIPLLLNLKMVKQGVSKMGLEGTRIRRILLDELLGNFIKDLRDHDVQLNNEELTETEILFHSFVNNMPHKKVADQLDVTYPTTYFKWRANAIDRLTYELIRLEISEKGEKSSLEFTHRM